MLRFLTYPKTLWRDRRGTAMLELTFIMPLLLVVGLGVLEFGNIIYKRHLIEAGLRDAARYVAGTNDCLANRDEGENLAATGTIDGSGALRVAGWLVADVDVDCVERDAEPTPQAGDTWTKDEMRGEGLYGAPTDKIYIVQAKTEIAYDKIDVGFFGVLAAWSPQLSKTNLFEVLHQERYYGGR